MYRGVSDKIYPPILFANDYSQLNIIFLNRADKRIFHSRHTHSALEDYALDIHARERSFRRVSNHNNMCDALPLHLYRISTNTDFHNTDTWKLALFSLVPGLHLKQHPSSQSYFCLSCRKVSACLYPGTQLGSRGGQLHYHYEQHIPKWSSPHLQDR